MGTSRTARRSQHKALDANGQALRRLQVQGDADPQQNQTSAKLAFVSVWFWLRLWFTFLFCQSSARFSDRLLIVLLTFLLIVFFGGSWFRQLRCRGLVGGSRLWTRAAPTKTPNVAQ